MIVALFFLPAAVFGGLGAHLLIATRRTLRAGRAGRPRWAVAWAYGGAASALLIATISFVFAGVLAFASLSA